MPRRLLLLLRLLSVLFAPSSFSNCRRGAGFSFADGGAVVRNEEQLRDAAVSALLVFASRHPQLAARPLYIFGESFAGRALGPRGPGIATDKSPRAPAH